MTQQAEKWRILVEPVSDNGVSEKKKNRGGLGIYLVTGAGSYPSKREVGRVAFERNNSTHPDVKFEDQLAVTVAAARAAVDMLEEQFQWAGEMA